MKTLTTEELEQKRMEAMSAMYAAVERAEDAVDSARVAARVYLHTSALLTTDPNGHLAQMAAQNRAGWSGGPYGRNNITESLLREEALELLNYERWRGLPWQLRPYKVTGEEK
jgi:hypothetical protein